ncbi:Pentatricopeptide repeat-containing protein [Apostasia shenzhenica]|uniref:Pentatricopeptide repeat-containing protein n=1 Tax=Apostasia shenzhenica TaxID=1088818 RepID=A0A2I0ABP7_9ASPA|nr:Pentatricopeptide repeat-containing protein [Apostasia shenzhenica]
MALFSLPFQTQFPSTSTSPTLSPSSSQFLRNPFSTNRRPLPRRHPLLSSKIAESPAANLPARRPKPREIVLGKPSVQLEKGRYSYEVETLINKLSSLPPRGSIARCLESFRGRLSLSDFALVFREFAQRTDWQRSLRLFKYMQRQIWCRPDEHIHAILIGVLGRESLLDKAREVFDEMPTNSVPRTALSYTSIINAYARNAQHGVALDLLAQMKAERIVPSVLTYNTILNACARADLPWDSLLSLFAEMRHDGIHPDIVTYNTLIAAAGGRGLADQAEMVLRSMLDSGVTPDSSTHAYLVDTFAKLGRLDRMSELLAEMEAGGHLLDAGAYNVLIEAHARSGEAKKAMGVLRQMQAAGCTPTAPTYSILLKLYGTNGQYESVRELFLEMKVGNTEPDASTYNILIQVFGEGGYFNEVVTLFHDMVEEKVEPNMETYEILISACGKGGLHRDAKVVLSHMNNNGVVPSSKAYTGVVEAFGQASLYEEAFVAFNTMHEIGSVPTLETYNSLIYSFARGGLFKEAEAILMRMNGAGIQRDEESFNGLIEAYCQGGQYEDAIKSYMEMQNSRCSPNERTLEAALNVYCTAGLVDQGREQFQEFKSAGLMPSVISYCMFLSLLAKNDRWDDAYQLLNEMETNRTSNTHQIIGSMIKGNYDNESNWQMVEYVVDKYNSAGCTWGLKFHNALLDALWWFGQKARAAQVLHGAIERGLFSELYRHSKLVWSVDVHRMSVGGALTAISVWLNGIQERFQNGEDLPHLATVVVARGVIEKSSVARELPVAKSAYAFLRENISQSFHFPGWSKGRIVCHRLQLKRVLSLNTEPSSNESIKMVPITNIDFPLPGSKLHTTGLSNYSEPADLMVASV